MTEQQAAEPPDQTISQRPRKRRRLWRAAGLAVALPVVLIGGLLAYALGRDLPAPDWMVTEIEDRAGAILNGGSLSIGDVRLILGRDLHPRVRLTGAVLRDATGAPIARVPLIEGLFSPRGALFQREALMQDVRLSGAQINLRRDQDGAVALSFGAGAQDVEAAPSFLDLLDQSDAVFELPVLAALETIRADGLIINYADIRAGRAWTVDGGRLSLDVRNAQTQLQGDFTVLSGGALPTDLSLSYASPRGSRAAAFELAVTEMPARDIAAQSPALSWLADVDAPLTARLTTARLDDGSLAPLVANLALGAGALQPNAATAPIAFEGAAIDLHFDPATNEIVFDEVSAIGDLGAVNATGAHPSLPGPDGLPTDFTGQFTLTDTRLPSHLPLDLPVTIPILQADMKLTLDPFRVDLGQVYTALPDVDILSTGYLAATDTGWDVAADLSISDISHTTLMALWPEQALAGTRRWFDRAVSDAAYNDIQISLRQAEAAPLQIAGSFAYRDMGMTFLRSMPPINAGAGTAVFTESSFAVAMNAGQVTAPDGGAVDMAGSTFQIPDLAASPRAAVYDLRIDGALPDILSLIDQPPMGYMTKAKLPTDVASGTARVQVDLSHPIKSGIRGADVAFAARADLRDVGSDRLIPDRQLAASSLALAVDKAGLTVTGAMQVDGVPVDGTWVQHFAGPVAGQFDASVRLSEPAMRRFGVDLPPGSVAGQGDAGLSLTVPRGGAPRYAITSDLRGLTVAIPAVGWSKPASTAGRLQLEGRLATAHRWTCWKLRGVV